MTSVSDAAAAAQKPKAGEPPMFCFQCQETWANKGCTKLGVCGKSPETAKRLDRLIQVCKQIAIACEGKDYDVIAIGRKICHWLFVTITNANFDDAAIERYIAEAVTLCATFDEPELKAPLGVLSAEDPGIRSLRELITYGLKGISAYSEHAAVVKKYDPEIYKFLIHALAEICKNRSVDDLVKLSLEVGNITVRAMALLDAANTETYGKPEISKVNIDVGQRPGILVSGHDLKDLKELLEQTKDAGIDIYTHGEMLPAHYYPELKKYPHLYGNYGNSWWRQNDDFTTFNGPILMTTNCIIPLRKAYADRIFTTGPVGYAGVKHIPDAPEGQQKDFSEIIALAKTCPPPQKIDDGHIVGGFAHDQVFALADKVVEAVKSGAIKKFVVMAGCDGRHKERDYFTEVAKKLPHDTVILTAGCAKYRYIKLDLGDIGGIPRILDAGQCNDCYSLALIALKLKEVFELDDVNKLPLAFDIGWYEQKAVAVLLALLALGFKNIRMGPTLPGFLSPDIADLLVKTFGICGITTPDQDIEAIMA